MPAHKRYLCVFWNNSVYVQHVAIEGLATAGRIQATVIDATIALLKFHNIEPAVKWMENFVFFRCPHEGLLPSGSQFHPYTFNLSSFMDITIPLGSPWHSLKWKDHDFKSKFTYVSFNWDLTTYTISLSPKKHFHLLNKVASVRVHSL